MPKRTIPQGQYVAPIHAAESFVGRRYIIEDSGGSYSANPADYWNAPDSAVLGAIVGPLTVRTVTGRTGTIYRPLKVNGTVGDLRRIARAIVGMVQP